MAAPIDIIWGDIVGNGGRIGIYVGLSNTDTTTTATFEGSGVSIVYPMIMNHFGLELIQPQNILIRKYFRKYQLGILMSQDGVLITKLKYTLMSLVIIGLKVTKPFIVAPH